MAVRHRLSAICYKLFLSAAAHDVFVGARVVARAIAQRGFAPGRLGSGHPDTGLAFTATVRVIARSHCHAAHAWTPTHVSLAPGFAELDGALLNVANLPNGR